VSNAAERLLTIMTYAEKLQDPRWQKKRHLIFERDQWKCSFCGTDKNIQVYHLVYSRRDPWEYPDEQLQTRCGACHKEREKIMDDFDAFVRMLLGQLPTDQMAVVGRKLIEQIKNNGHGT